MIKSPPVTAETAPDGGLHPRLMVPGRRAGEPPTGKLPRPAAINLLSAIAPAAGRRGRKGERRRVPARSLAVSLRFGLPHGGGYTQQRSQLRCRPEGFIKNERFLDTTGYAAGYGESLSPDRCSMNEVWGIKIMTGNKMAYMTGNESDIVTGYGIMIITGNKNQGHPDGTCECIRE